MARISLHKIKKTYGSVPVLNDTNLDIADGEFLTLVGPSGCGKSTTLRIIAGLETQTEGDVKIDGKIVNKIRPNRRDLAMVFQSYALYPHLTVFQNLATPLKLRDLNFWERFPIVRRFIPGFKEKIGNLNGTVIETASILQIEHLLHRRPKELSGGQRQRVALGRAMVRKPAAFLMDEPLSNLDAGLRVHMRAELAELHKTLGATFIYVTHDQAEALTMSDRVAVMIDGDILQVGAPNHIYEEPASIRVAEFVGSPKINILGGECDNLGNITSVGIKLKSQLQNSSNKKVFIGIRPEHFNLQTSPKTDCFTGSLAYRENLGSDIYLHILLTDNNHRLIVRVNPSEAQNISIGNEVTVEPELEKIHIFGDDGHRLQALDALS